jgi:MFS family permease
MMDGIPTPVRRVLLGVFLNFLGSGLTMSLLMVYLHDIRGISIATAGFLLAWQAVIGIAMTAPIGYLIDRHGPVRVMVPGILMEAVAVASISWVQTVPQAFVVATLGAICGATIWPSQTTLYSQLTQPKDRERVFALSFMFLNLGLGIGGLLTSAIVRDGDAARFELLYRIDAATYLFLAIAVWTVRTHAAAARETFDRQRAAEGSYAEVLRDRRLQRLALGGVVTFICGYGSVMSGVPVFATQQLDLSVRWLGVIYGVNTFLIVAFQALVVSRIRGRSRSLVMASVGVIWALSWVAMGMAQFVAPVLLLVVAQGVFAVGEMLWAPVGPAVVNSIAPDELRGRYNAVVGLQWGISGIVGPALTGFMLARDLAAQWIGLLFVGSLLGAALLGSLRRLLDPVTDGRVAESAHD